MRTDTIVRCKHTIVHKPARRRNEGGEHQRHSCRIGVDNLRSEVCAKTRLAALRGPECTNNTEEPNCLNKEPDPGVEPEQLWCKELLTPSAQRDFIIVTGQKDNWTFYFRLIKLVFKFRFHTVLLCLYLADPATLQPCPLNLIVPILNLFKKLQTAPLN